MKKFHIAAIVVILLIIVVNVYFYSKYSTGIDVIFGPNNKPPPETTTTTETIPPRFIETKCNATSDCSWQSTNCCGETAGAMWECVNGRTFQSGCSKNILCPQFISPKPSSSCVCEQGNCVEK